MKIDASHLRTVLRPLATTRVRLPGFDYQPNIQVLLNHPPEEQLADESTLGTDHLLHLWMISKRLAGYTPSEAILVMNAWPANTRQIGAALSDFLTETRALMKYSLATPRFRSPRQAKLIITFNYRGIDGTIIVK